MAAAVPALAMPWIACPGALLAVVLTDNCRHTIPAQAVTLAPVLLLFPTRLRRPDTT
ncbi:MAG: hypothetical protein AAFZ09_02200 [Pseudomonadota bacterium]